MGRGAYCGAIVATLVVTAVAVGAGADVRLHRLHVPPPPSVDASESAPPPAPSPPGSPVAPPGTPSPPAQPPPPGAPPPPPAPAPPPPPAPVVGCTPSGGGTTAEVTGTLSDFEIDLVPTTVTATASLRFRGVNTMGSVIHNLSLMSGATRLCGTPDLAANMAETFTVTNLQPGSYVIYCSRHPTQMNEPLTVS